MVKKRSLRKQRHVRELTLGKEKVMLARITEKSRIILADTKLVDNENRKWFINK